MESIVIRNSRDYYDLKNLQTEMLETAKIQRNVNKIRIKEMHKIQQELRDRFVKTNAFIKECEEKTENAKNRITDNKKIHSVIDANIDKLRAKIVELTDFKDVLADTVKRMIPYETVIQEVVNQSDVLKSVSDCIARSDALSELCVFQSFWNIEILYLNHLRPTQDFWFWGTVWQFQQILLRFGFGVKIATFQNSKKSSK